MEAASWDVLCNSTKQVLSFGQCTHCEVLIPLPLGQLELFPPTSVIFVSWKAEGRWRVLSSQLGLSQWLKYFINSCFHMVVPGGLFLSTQTPFGQTWAFSLLSPTSFHGRRVGTVCLFPADCGGWSSLDGATSVSCTLRAWCLPRALCCLFRATSPLRQRTALDALF